MTIVNPHSLTTEIKIGGFGGQGVILAGLIIGKAASIYDHKYAVMTQSFGPEARGSAASSEVIISEVPITYPYVTNPDILVVLSKEAARRYLPLLKPEGTIIYEKDLVNLEECDSSIVSKARVFGIPATRIAEELRITMVTNIVVLGFFTAVTELISVDAMREAIKDSVPKGTESINLQAFQRGFEFGFDLKEKYEVP